MIAFVFASDPVIAQGGSTLRVRELSTRLAKYFDVDLIEVDRPSGGRVSSARRRIRGAVAGVPPRLSSHLHRSEERSVADAVMGASLVVVSTTFSVPLVARGVRPMVLDAHNLEWRVVEQLRGAHRSRLRRVAYWATAGWTRRYESAVARRADLVWAVSEREAQWFREAGAPRVTVVRNGVSLPPEVAPLPPEPVLLFVGSLATAFNRDGMDWFIGECWPRLRQLVPLVRLLIVGDGGDRYRGTAGVEPLGFVSDLEPIYAQATVAIAPLLSGSGTRLKIVEALAFGRPVVSTTVGAEGLDLTSGVHLELADSPAAFAAACAFLLRDRELARKRGDAGRRLVDDLYDWDKIASIAAASIQGLASTQGPRK